ncbi:uncharacterized protein LOC110821645 [Carica papaya]|uniref:uncharacterized protein LOC110821645 n=1 Tax=Carica papaya TaxID=3649 RepID=UPI000B8CE69B|nr:uncharacterized protein LOC110821645 [Carica papaya]
MVSEPLVLRDMWKEYSLPTNPKISKLVTKLATCSGSSAPPHFNGENYHVWALKMEIHLQSLNLWDVVLNDTEPPPLRDITSLTQIKRHEEELMKKHRALACIHSAISDMVFSRIMPYKTPKLAWDKIREEFEGGTRSRRTKLLKLKAEFVMLRMREDEALRQYASKLMDVVNKIRLLGENFPDSRVVKHILICLLARFESKISVLEELNDTDTITAVELMNKLESQQQ